MVEGGHLRKKYPSDLTDEQWAIVESLLPPVKRSPRGGRPRKVHMRAVLHTLFSLNRSGGQWAMVPHDLLPKIIHIPPLRLLGPAHHTAWCASPQTPDRPAPLSCHPPTPAESPATAPH